MNSQYGEQVGYNGEEEQETIFYYFMDTPNLPCQDKPHSVGPVHNSKEHPLC